MKKVQDFYDNIQMPVPTEKDYQEAEAVIGKLMIPPAARRNLSRGIFNPNDSAIWDRLGYGEIHRRRCYANHPSKTDLAAAWEEVGKLLSHPVMRTALDACTLAGVDEEKLSLVLPTVYHLSCSEAAQRLYKRYFADFEMWGKVDWKDYLDRLREDTYVYTRIFTALTRPRNEVYHLCGLPTEKQYSDFLKNVLAGAAYKFDYYARQNTAEADNEARKWAKVGFEAGEKFEKYGANDVSDFAKLVQTEFEYVTPQIPNLDAEMAAQIRPQIEDSKDKK